MCCEDESRITGFYAVNAHSIIAEAMPERWAKKAPRHGVLPAAFIAMMGVHKDCQGREIGTALLFDALKRLARLADDLAIAVVVLDVLDDGDAGAVQKRAQWYVGFGFQSLPNQPLRMFFPITTVRALL